MERPILQGTKKLVMLNNQRICNFMGLMEVREPVEMDNTIILLHKMESGNRVPRAGAMMANNSPMKGGMEMVEYSSPRGRGPGEHDWKNGPLAGLQEMGQGGQGYTYDPFTGQSEERVNDSLSYSGVPQQRPDGEYQANAQGGGAGIQPFYGNGQGWSPYQMYQEGGTQVELQDVFFEYDSWRITQEGTQALAHDADWLGENQARSLTVEGHCDQRGTQNYNMVLGEKRAEAVRSYLIDLGVDSFSKLKLFPMEKNVHFVWGPTIGVCN